MNCDDSSITGKLSSLFRKTYEKGEEERKYRLCSKYDELKLVLKDKINIEIDNLKKCEKEYIPKLMEIFLETPVSNMSICSVKSLDRNRIELDINITAKIPKEIAEYSKMEFSKNNNSICFSDGTRFTVKTVHVEYFTIHMITTFKYAKELLGEDIVKKIYAEVYNSRDVKMPDNLDVMGDYYIN